MKFTKSVLALSIALAVGNVAAATKSQDEDSVHQWGRWAVLVPEAGGDPDPFIKVDGSRDLRPEDAKEYERLVKTDAEPPAPPVEPPVVEGHCQAGASCSYATYEYRYNSYGGYGDGYSEEHGSRVPANIKLDVEFTETAAAVQPAAIGIPPLDGGEVGVTADFTVAPTTPDPNYPTVADRHTEEDHIHDYDDGTMYWHAESSNYDNGYTDSRINGSMAPGLLEDTTAGWWSDGAEGYNDSGVSEWFDRMGTYVAGTATNMAYLNSLNAGNVEARYVGFAADNGVPVRIDVDFGDSSWRGSWNGGRDGYVQVATDSNGVRHVEGEVGFNASGHLSGPNIISDRVSAADGRVTGSVEGSFFGSQAQVLGGISDITKTVTESTVGEGGTVYNAARNVDTFATIKEELAEQVGDVFRNID